MSQKTVNTNSIDWKPEMDQSILRYHTIACWIGVVFNIVFFATDYINEYAYWHTFLAIRICVSLIILIAILFYKPLKISVEMLAFIPVLLISLQNTYMWSVMDMGQLQKHTLAYIALFIGSGLLVMYRTYYSIAIIILSLVANVICFKLNSRLNFQQILANGGLLTFSVAVFSILLIRTRYNLTKKEIISRLALKESNALLVDKNQIIEEKNKEIISSINYAQRIQDALIPPPDLLNTLLNDCFVFFQPKDIVSGDFYWATELTTTREQQKNEKLVVFSVADCTGHGVPGAFLSIIGLKILNASIQQEQVNSPAEALDFVNHEIYNTVNSHNKGDVIRDGMDMALCSINFKTLKLSFAGANNPVYIVRNKQLHEIKGDKQPIGAYEKQTPFTNQEFQLQKGDMVYIFSDGYADQFGGPENKKFKYHRFKNLLTEMSDQPIREQEKKIINTFEEWKDDREQVDDICIIGLRI